MTEPAPDLSAVAKLASTPAITPGQALTYTLVLPNGGDRTAPARLTDTLPLSLTWGGVVTATAGTPTWDEAGRRLLWSGTISPGLVVTITYRVTVNPGLAQRIAQDTGTRLVFLYTGSLSEPGGPASDYLSLMRYDVSAIVDALK